MSYRDKKPSNFSFSALDLCPAVLVLFIFEDEIPRAAFWSTTTLKIVATMVAASLGFFIGRQAFKAFKALLNNRK